MQKMKNRDLQAIIRDMAARLDSCRSDDAGPRPGLLNEVEAYMAVDPALARLHKEFMDSRRTRIRALEQQGEGSAMADIARDLEESAQSAMETRMIELRADEIKRAMVERMMIHAHMQEMDDYRQESRTRSMRYAAEWQAEQKQDQMIAARRQHEGEDSFFMLMMMWWMMRQMVWRTNKKLSLASSFSQALKKAFDREPDYRSSAA